MSRNFVFSWDDVELREFKEEDIEPFSYYWFHCKDSAHVHRLIDWNKFPNENEFKINTLNKIRDGSMKYATVVVFQNKTIGVHMLNNLLDDGADFHAHFWNTEYRGKRIGLVSSVKAGKFFFKSLNLKYINIKVPLENKMSSTAAKKSGLKCLGREEYKSPFVKENVIVDVYRVEKDQIDKVESVIRKYLSGM